MTDTLTAEQAPVFDLSDLSGGDFSQHTGEPPRRVAALPNCDGCGRFTSAPHIESFCTGGNNLVVHECHERFLCPACVARKGDA
jgi:hypothetical protein